jgi:hypothetical protein
MALSPKMLELQRAIDFYGDTTLRNFEAAHKFGDEITYTMAEFLGEGAEVLGVPPEGDWTHHKGDYNDAKYSTFHTGYLRIEPVKMGIAIRIPHSMDDGEFWIRIMAELDFVGDTMNIRVGDKTLAGVSLAYSKANVKGVQELIFNYACDTLNHPAAAATGHGRASFGFIDHNAG